MRLFELGLREFFLMDSIWVILLSVSTVGYGDIFPETDYGRFVLVLHQVAGVVVLSTLVAVLQSKLSLSNRYGGANVVVRQSSVVALNNRVDFTHPCK